MCHSVEKQFEFVGTGKLLVTLWATVTNPSQQKHHAERKRSIRNIPPFQVFQYTRVGHQTQAQESDTRSTCRPSLAPVHTLDLALAKHIRFKEVVCMTLTYDVRGAHKENMRAETEGY